MVAWSLMCNNLFLNFHELENFIEDFKHIYLVFQHIIFISLESSIFPLRNEQSLFFYTQVMVSYVQLISYLLQKMTKNVFF